MSRIGKKPVPIPEGVSVDVKDKVITVSGPKGKVTRPLPSGVKIKVDGGQIVVERERDDKEIRALHGLTRALVNNMVQGVSSGYSKSLEIVGTGYKAEDGGKGVLRLSLGYSNPVEFVLPEGISVTVEERGTRLTLSGIDKELLGETAARIRRLRPPDSYKGKGIRYLGEALKLKAGKSGVKK
jgi:large subunit ribosomal protein L6